MPKIVAKPEITDFEVTDFDTDSTLDQTSSEDEYDVNIAPQGKRQTSDSHEEHLT